MDDTKACWGSVGTSRSSASASNWMTRRPASAATRAGVTGVISKITDVLFAPLSTRVTMRGTRRSPVTSSRDGRRRSSRRSSASDSARGRKSSGTYQRLSRLKAGAGSETSRPATDTTVWSAVTMMVRPPAVMVSPPAASRAEVPNGAASSSTAT